MKITILTLFPDMFTGPFDVSIIKRAKDQNKVSIKLVNIRDYAIDRYKSVDDHPYGGGPGMIMKVDVIDRALESQKSKIKSLKSKTILLDPAGLKYSQKKARQYSKLDHLILICGHYEGVDERVRTLADESISVGSYIVTGGEIPAMVITDSVIRLIPGVLKKPEATQLESFSDSRSALEYPQYTRPEEYQGMKIPDILLSGNHAEIIKWQKEQSLLRTTKHKAYKH